VFIKLWPVSNLSPSIRTWNGSAPPLQWVVECEL
jgi:hypothetical protein